MTPLVDPQDARCEILRAGYALLNVRLIRELDLIAREDEESVLPQGLDRFTVELGDLASILP